MSAFIDEVTLFAKAGDGGNGIVAWRREAHVARGGPAGGDGGDGGDVVFVASDDVHSLLDFKYEPRLLAQDGQPGRGKCQAGHGGADTVAKVPVGTQILDKDTGVLLCDLTEIGQVFVACRGGSGGFGNSRFATPSRQAPEFAKPGLEGESRNLTLSLKLMADVGLLGFPNAGKSTFLARVSAARPKIANYPFTTLVPQLGVVALSDRQKDPADQRTFVVADIPGLVEGAASGAGLGVRFLKHLERVRVLLHLVEVPLWEVAVAQGDVPAEDVVAPTHLTQGPTDLVERYEALRTELVGFSAELAARDEVVVLNKTDLLPGNAKDHPEVRKLAAHLKKQGVPLYFLSGATGEGLQPVLEALWQGVVRTRQAERQEAGAANTDPEAAAPFDPLR